MKFRPAHLAILILVAIIAGMLIYESGKEAHIDKHYQQNAKITKEEAIQIAKQFIKENISESSYGYPENINAPARIGDGVRKWAVAYLIRGKESHPNTIVIEVDKIDGRTIFVPQR